MDEGPVLQRRIAVWLGATAVAGGPVRAGACWPEQPSRTWAVLTKDIVRVGQRAPVDGQAATANAVGELVAELQQVPHSPVELGLPVSGIDVASRPG